MITLAPDDNLSSQMKYFIPQDNISMITLAPDDKIAS
jgi:hypothetical protein